MDDGDEEWEEEATLVNSERIVPRVTSVVVQYVFSGGRKKAARKSIVSFVETSARPPTRMLVHRLISVLLLPSSLSG